MWIILKWFFFNISLNSFTTALGNKGKLPIHFMSLAVTQTSMNKAMLSQDIPAPIQVYSLLLLEHLLLCSLLDFFPSKMTFCSLWKPSSSPPAWYRNTTCWKLMWRSKSHRWHSWKFWQDCFPWTHYFTWTEKAVSCSMPSWQITLSLSVFWVNTFFFFFFPLHLQSNSEWELYAEGSAQFPVCLANIHGVLLRAQLSHPLSTQKCTLRGRRKTRLEKTPESTGHQLLATLLAQSSTGAKTSPALPSQLSFQRWHFSTLSQLAPTCMENKSSALPPAAHKPNPTFPKHAWCWFTPREAWKVTQYLRAET